ncbi:MAG: hypothetical protein LC808_35610, partial [Actinobacteria bacterium]|nr:hypothetical protein [Actinomycetota bacterium]
MDVRGRSVDAESAALVHRDNRIASEQEISRSPLTDSNCRPPLYEEGPCVKWWVVGIAQSGRVPRWWVASGAHLSIASS